MANYIEMKIPEFVIDVDALVNDPVNRRKLGRFIVKRHMDMDKIIDDFIADPKNEEELRRFAAHVVYSKTGRDLVGLSDDLMPLFYEEHKEEEEQKLPAEDPNGPVDFLDEL